ncbi:MAG: ThiF family adenylyltransferase [Gammaproteobacteria bacterium]|nr:ThiF family adenylyltransferase [Gammaproteobacteria bacterium]
MSQHSRFSISEAFGRNLGLISKEEQQRLFGSLASIVGCGGVGGYHALTLARLGIGRFRLTDPDEFSVANFNRQIGATIESVDKNKAEITAAQIKSINPDAQVEIYPGGLSKDNVEAFVKGADIAIDGVDFFSIGVRRLFFAEARRQQVTSLTAAPLGFSGSLLVFSHGSMSFDEYFSLSDGQSYADQIINFLIGLAPSALHLPYMDFSSVDPASGRGPSSVIGVQQAASLLSAQALKVLLGRGGMRYAPHYIQFDAYRQKLATGYLRSGNRNWKQRLKRQLVVKKFSAIGLLDQLKQMG